jgi:prepilin-type N-terminal cleavage/methylation domain-containing protein
VKLAFASSSTRGYTLIELLVATSIIMMGAVAAYHLAINATKVEEMNSRLTRGLSLQENYARLWQVGMSPSAISVLLPRSNEVSISSTAESVGLTKPGPMEGLTIRANLTTGMVNGVTRPNDVTVLRATR